MNMFLAAFRFFLQPLLLSFVPFPTNVNFVPYFVLCSFAAFYTPLSTPFPLFLSRPFSAPALPDHISGNSGFRPLLLRSLSARNLSADIGASRDGRRKCRFCWAPFK